MGGMWCTYMSYKVDNQTMYMQRIKFYNEVKLESTSPTYHKHKMYKHIFWHQTSEQYNNNPWKKANCANCTYTNDIKKADVVFAHPHKTKIHRAFPKQMWISQFWVSEKNYPDINRETFDASISYRKDATFPNYAMIQDTFDYNNLVKPIPYKEKLQNEWMSIWISNCGFSERNKLLKKLHISTASYGRCKRDHSLRGSLKYVSPKLEEMDNSPDMSGNQKMAHVSQHLFLFAAENTISPYYHTEKLYHGLMVGSIPIYYGADTIDDFVPTHSIIKISEYGDNLESYIREVANNETLYESYLQWRNKPLSATLQAILDKPPPSQCEVCNVLIYSAS